MQAEVWVGDPATEHDLAHRRVRALTLEFFTRGPIAQSPPDPRNRFLMNKEIEEPDWKSAVLQN